MHTRWFETIGALSMTILVLIETCIFTITTVTNLRSHQQRGHADIVKHPNSSSDPVVSPSTLLPLDNVIALLYGNTIIPHV